MTSAILTVTSVGLAAAANAAENSLKVTLASFRIGSAVGYVPSVSDTSLHGTVLYYGTITSYANQSDGSLLLNCTIPTEAGPFAFGEVGIYTDAGALFALAALPTPQQKYPSLGDEIPSTFTFSLFLKFGHAPAVFNILTTGASQYPIQYVANWASVAPISGLEPFPVYQLIVAEPDNKGDYTTIAAKASGQWSIQGNYYALGKAPILEVAPDFSYVKISVTAWTSLVAGDPSASIYAASTHSLVFESDQGYFRMTTVSLSDPYVVLNFSTPLPGLITGDDAELYVNHASFGSVAGSVTGYQEETVTATVEGQTVVNFTSLTYTPGMQMLQVYLNGFRINATDFSETSSTTITLNSALSISGVNGPDQITGVVGGTGTGSTPGSGVSSFNTRTGAVTLTGSDVTSALGYTPANVNSPALTGTPTATTAAPGTNTTQIATTAFVTSAVSASVAGVASFNTRTGAVVLTSPDVTGALGYTPANTVSPTFSGAPTAPTPASGSNSTQIATTAFVAAAIAASGGGGSSGVSSFNTRTGVVTLNGSDVTSALGYTPANTVSPSFSGVPTAPTATAGTNTTQLATTAFVAAAVAGSVSGVSSFNTRTGAVTLTQGDLSSTIASAPFTVATTGTSTTNSIHLTRNATYSGGTTGWVNAALFQETTTGASSTSFEWGIVSVLHNYATRTTLSENVGFYSQGNKMSTGHTWGGVVEMCDLTNTAATQAGDIAWGMEVDCWCNGTDGYGNRIIQNLVVGNAQQIRGLGSGAKAYADIGLRVSAYGDQAANAACNNGIVVATGEINAVQITCSGQRAVQTTGTYVVGVDLSGATHTGGSAVRVKAGDFIAFDQFDQFRMRFNASTGFLEFFNGVTRKGYIDMNGTDHAL